MSGLKIADAPSCSARRLDKLRTLVPHAERANTASFLEEVIHYIEELQALLKCGPNHATGAPPTHPSAALAAAVQQQQQRQHQVPACLSATSNGRYAYHQSHTAG
jgi:Helix-loop-helix DNA-binding domain